MTTSRPPCPRAIGPRRRPRSRRSPPTSAASWSRWSRCRDYLERVVHAVRRHVSGCDEVGVTILSAGRPHTAAYTTVQTLEIDAVQYALDDGPCLDAARNRRENRVDDLVVDDGRWPEFAKECREDGMRSLLALPLVSGDGVRRRDQPLRLGTARLRRLRRLARAGRGLALRRRRGRRLGARRRAAARRPARAGDGQPGGHRAGQGRHHGDARGARARGVRGAAQDLPGPQRQGARARPADRHRCRRAGGARGASERCPSIEPCRDPMPQHCSRTPTTGARSPRAAVARVDHPRRAPHRLRQRDPAARVRPRHHDPRAPRGRARGADVRRAAAGGRARDPRLAGLLRDTGGRRAGDRAGQRAHRHHAHRPRRLHRPHRARPRPVARVAPDLRRVARARRPSTCRCSSSAPR